MKTIVNRLLVIAFIILSFSCEITDNSGSGDVVSKLEGQWQCEEYSSYFNNIFIVIHPLHDIKALIENFYELSDNVYVEAEISDMTLVIPLQVTDGEFNIYGNGNILSNNKKITSTYYAEDGSRQIDEVEATYTKID